MTTATRVCWSMISDTQTAYGCGVRRQGRSRRLIVYQSSSLRRIRAIFAGSRFADSRFADSASDLTIRSDYDMDRGAVSRGWWRGSNPGTFPNARIPSQKLQGQRLNLVDCAEWRR